jgi:hypothetical protein
MWRLLILFGSLITAFLVCLSFAPETHGAGYGFSRSSKEYIGGNCMSFVIDRVAYHDGTNVTELTTASLDPGSWIATYDGAYAYGLYPRASYNLRDIAVGQVVTPWCTGPGNDLRVDYKAYTDWRYTLHGGGSFNVGYRLHISIILTGAVWPTSQISNLGFSREEYQRPLDLWNWDPCYTQGTPNFSASIPRYNAPSQALTFGMRLLSSPDIYSISDYGAWYLADWDTGGSVYAARNARNWATGVGGQFTYGPPYWNGIGQGYFSFTPGQNLPPRNFGNQAIDGVFYYDNISALDANSVGGLDAGKSNGPGKAFGVCYILNSDLRANSATVTTPAGGFKEGVGFTYSGSVYNYSSSVRTRPTSNFSQVIRASDGVAMSAVVTNIGVVGTGTQINLGTGGWTPGAGQAGNYYIRTCADYTNLAYQANAGRCINSGIFTVASNPAPTCTSAAPAQATVNRATGTLDLYAYGVNNATTVQFPTWSDYSGQNDLGTEGWINGVNLGGGTWRATTNLANHTELGINTGLINVHVYMFNAAYSYVFCGAANFTVQPPPPDLTTDWLQLTNGSGTAKTTFAVDENIYIRTRIWNVNANSGAPSGYSRTGFYSRTTDATPAFTLLHGTFAANTSYAYCSWISSTSIADIHFNPCYGVDARYADGSGGAAKSWKMSTPGRYTMKMQINYLPGNDQSYEGPAGSANYTNNTATLAYDVTPLAPASLIANRSECVDYSLSWTPTTITNGSIQYRITIRQGATVVRQVTQASPSYTVSGIGNPLVESSTYTWTVESLWTSPGGTTFTSPAATGPGLTTTECRRANISNSSLSMLRGDSRSVMTQALVSPNSTTTQPYKWGSAAHAITMNVAKIVQGTGCAGTTATTAVGLTFPNGTTQQQFDYVSGASISMNPTVTVSPSAPNGQYSICFGFTSPTSVYPGLTPSSTYPSTTSTQPFITISVRDRPMLQIDVPRATACTGQTITIKAAGMPLPQDVYDVSSPLIYPNIDLFLNNVKVTRFGQVKGTSSVGMDGDPNGNPNPVYQNLQYCNTGTAVNGSQVKVEFANDGPGTSAANSYVDATGATVTLPADDPGGENGGWLGRGSDRYIDCETRHPAPTEAYCDYYDRQIEVVSISINGTVFLTRNAATYVSGAYYGGCWAGFNGPQPGGADTNLVTCDMSSTTNGYIQYYNQTIASTPAAAAPFTGDVHSNGSMAFDNRGGDLASPKNRYFADGVAGVISSRSTLSIAASFSNYSPFSSPANNWLASTYPTTATIDLQSLKSAFAHLEANTVANLGKTPTVVTGNVVTANSSLCGTDGIIRLVPASGNDVYLNGWTANSTQGCKTILVGSTTTPVSLVINAEIKTVASGNISPMAILVSGNLRVDGSVGQLDATFIWRGGFEDACNLGTCSSGGVTVNKLTVNGALLGLGEMGDASNTGFLLVGVNGLERYISDPSVPSERIIYQPQALDYLRTILGKGYYSWLEN